MFQLLIGKVRSQLDKLPQLAGSISAQDVAVETPPNVSMGELALPVAFALARTLKKSPKAIAHELAGALSLVPGVARVDVAGAGYLNLYLDRNAWLQTLLRSILKKSFSLEEPRAPALAKIIVEHTNINPNKAAHIGHLRNAILGDSFVRLLRFLKHKVEVQNYIDNTGVQVADVVVGFRHLARISPEAVQSKGQPFDYFCWDLYAKVTTFFAEDSSRLQLRHQTLQAIEAGDGEIARIAETVAMNNVRAHLATMQRVHVYYDLLPRESDILRLHFWDKAFHQLKERGAIQLVTKGKNTGCWVMKLDGAPVAPEDEDGADEKVIVRSNGTVTYVGKDIAYQLWKLGLLGLDFRYRPFLKYPNNHLVWVTTSEPQKDPCALAFGAADRVYNVIDKRQSYLQDIVVEGLKALQYEQQAANSIHFSYEMVALSPPCCEELGIALSEVDRAKPYVEVSGRKGLGVKADDLITRLEEHALAEVRARHQLSVEETARISHQIAVSALRYFMLKFTRNSVIAFDFHEALSFEGETGPYLQYSVVRADNIFRKLEEAEPGCLEEVWRDALETDFSPWLDANDDMWELVLLASRLSEVARQVQQTMELSILAKYAFNLAQKFNLFYHRHHILSETDRGKRRFLLLLADIYRKHMTNTLDLLGIEAPERM